jgi:hypothetical protein
MHRGLHPGPAGGVSRMRGLLAIAFFAIRVPLAIALPPLFWVVDATRRASVTALGRDQGIFQYVAWAIRRGAVDYRDVRDVNGPLTHWVHLVFLSLGGADEHRFRVLDLVVTGASFAAVGACLPRLRGAVQPRLAERVAWALAAWVALSAQYLLYSWWDSAQRESFFDWFMLPGLAVQLAAQRPSERRGQALLAVAGVLSVTPWFGKPTYALVTAAQALALGLDRRLPSRRRALGVFAAGVAASALAHVALLAIIGDVAAFLRIQLVDVPAMYRFIWPRTAAEILSTPFFATSAALAVTGGVTLGSLVAVGEMPASVTAVALAPICALAGVMIQAKGFPYHFHPVTAGVVLQWLVFAAWLDDRTRVARRRLAAVRLVPLGVAAAIGLHLATGMSDAPTIRDPWLLWGARSAEARESAGYFAHFTRVDFFPNELRAAAAYVRDHTQPGDTVQTYGMDPYVLFLSGRMSATPYLYAYDLNADAALVGGTAAVPGEEQAARIRAMREEHELDLMARVTARPPGAFVFMDASPLLSQTDAWDDFEEHCTTTAGWVRDHYAEAARFGHDHVWLRNDLLPAAEAAQPTRNKH